MYVYYHLTALHIALSTHITQTDIVFKSIVRAAIVGVIPLAISIFEPEYSMQIKKKMNIIEAVSLL